MVRSGVDGSAQPEPLPNPRCKLRTVTGRGCRARLPRGGCPSSSRTFSVIEFFFFSLSLSSLFIFFFMLPIRAHIDDIDVPHGEKRVARTGLLIRSYPRVSSCSFFLPLSRVRFLTNRYFRHSPPSVRLRISSLCASRRSSFCSSSSLFLFLFSSVALYSRMFIWRIYIIYACCGTPPGSAL